MSSEQDPYQCVYNQYVDGVEPLNGYKPGGFPIIQIGDLLHDNRYKVVDKLGRGGSSTIWLASCTQSNEPALCSVHDAKESSYFRPLPLSIARRLIADLVVTVQSMHAQGVVHGGMFR